MPNKEPASAIFGNSSVRVGTQGLFRPYLKTFVAPFLPTGLIAPGSPRMNLCTYGEGMGRSRWAGTPSYDDNPLVGIHICPRPCQKATEKPTQHSLLQRLLRKTLIGDICIAMVIVKFHTWRYALSLSRSLQCLMAVQMVNVKPQSSTRQWRSTV